MSLTCKTFKSLAFIDTNDCYVTGAARGEYSVKRGQDLLYVHSQTGYTALHTAVCFGKLAVVTQLLSTSDAKALANFRDRKNGRTPLHLAAKIGRVEFVKLLIAAGADRMLTDATGQIPCQLANAAGHIECRDLLKLEPPLIHNIQVVEVSSRRICLSWIPPVIIEEVHSQIQYYRISWHPVNREADAPAAAAHYQDDVQIYISKEPTTVLDRLLPYSGYSFSVASVSAAGVSEESSKIVIFTERCVPDASDSPDVIKVSSTSATIVWFHPKNLNGATIDGFQIELSGSSKVRIRNTTRGDPNIESDTEQLLELPDHPKSDHESQCRIFNHREILTCRRDLNGLAEDQTYRCRLRCHTDFGFSEWSVWTEPWTPQVGVKANGFKESLGEENNQSSILFRCTSAEASFGSSITAHLSWFRPILQNRHIICYELQLCLVHGPLHKIANMVGSSMAEKEDRDFYNFNTISDNIRGCEVEISDLRAGCKYIYRVRPKIDDTWIDWDLSLWSYIIATPPCSPDPPEEVHLLLAEDVEDNSADYAAGNGISLATDNDGSSLKSTSQSAVASYYGPLLLYNSSSGCNMTTMTTDAIELIEENFSFDALAVSHDSVVLGWSGGRSNGSPILEYHIEKRRDDDSWTDATSVAAFLGPQVVRVNGLIPGLLYSFHVRQRNDRGWSLFSTPLAVRTRYAVNPPKPSVSRIFSTSVMIWWFESPGAFTALDYEVEIGIVLEKSIQWIGTVKLVDLTARSGRDVQIIDVHVDKLIPATTYAVRCRIRTIMGNSAWSRRATFKTSSI